MIYVGFLFLELPYLPILILPKHHLLLFEDVHSNLGTVIFLRYVPMIIVFTVLD